MTFSPSLAVGTSELFSVRALLHSINVPGRGTCGGVVQLVRMPACHAGGHGFESRPSPPLSPGQATHVAF